MDIGTLQHRILKIALGFLVQNNGVNFFQNATNWSIFVWAQVDELSKSLFGGKNYCLAEFVSVLL